MDRYQKVEKPREDERVNENEIRITMKGRIRNYITYAMGLLQEKDSGEIVLKAMGRAINKTVMIAELIKRRVVGLHQNTSVSSTDITDTWEPLEEGLLPMETVRHVSTITITLSKKELDTSSSGYQSPIPADKVKSLPGLGLEGGDLPARGRGRFGRGRNRGATNVMTGYNGNGDYDAGYGYGGRGRGRGRGRDRDYDGGDEHHESTESNNASVVAPPRGRGRARGRVRGGWSHRADAPVPA